MAQSATKKVLKLRNNQLFTVYFNDLNRTFAVNFLQHKNNLQFWTTTEKALYLLLTNIAIVEDRI